MLKNYFLVAAGFFMVCIFISLTYQRPRKRSTFSLTVFDEENEVKGRDSAQCEDLLNRNESGFDGNQGLKVLAARPGSGSGFCSVSLHLLTGLERSTIKQLTKGASYNELRFHNLYFKTHSTLVDKKTNVPYSNPSLARVVVVIRHPFDAAFSEYVRHTAVSKPLSNKAHAMKTNKKYRKINRLVSDDFLMHEDMTSGNDTRPSDGFVEWYEDYLLKWTKFHRYWLTEYEGKLKVYFYRDLVDDISLFKEIAAFFGFDVMKSTERKRRSDCFLAHGEKMAEKLRPLVPLIENAKVVLKDYYAEKTREAIAHLEKLLQDKYNRKFTITS